MVKKLVNLATIALTIQLSICGEVLCNSSFLGGDCLEIIDPSTGMSSTSFVVDTICQGESLDFCFTTAGCDNDVEITNFFGNQGQIIVTPPSTPFNYCFSYTAPANLVGEDSFFMEVSNFDGLGNVESTIQVELTFVVVDPQNNTTVSAPQELCSPANSATITAINPDPIIQGYWVTLQGGGNISDINDPNALVTNIPFGENIYMWRQDYPCQSTFDLTIVNIYDGQAPVADAGPDVEMCSSNDTYVMQANDPLFSATGTWEITFGNATINDINDPNAIVTNIGIGCNVFEWNIENGPCPGGETVSEMVICVYDLNTPDADAGEDIDICFDGAGNNFILTNALDLEPYDPATGSWNLIEGFGVIEDNDDNETLIENLQIGTNIFTWTVENGNCPDWPQTDTLLVNVFDPNHPFPNAGVDTEYCAPINFHQLSASDAVAPAVGQWSVVSGTGAFADVNDPNTLVSNLSIGLNTFRWFIDNGPCNDDSFYDEVTIIVFDPNVEEASAGDDISFCDDSFTSYNLDGSQVIFPALGVWSVVSPLSVNAEDILSDVNNPNATLSGISPGNYELQWSVNNGPCNSDDNFDIVVVSLFPAAQITADPGEDLELCTPITSFQLSGNTPLEPAVGTWSLISGQGAISEPNNPSSSVTNLGIGINQFEWSIDNGACDGTSSSGIVTITVFNVNTEPAFAGPDQQACVDPNNLPTISLNASSPDAPATGVWSVTQGSGSFSSNTNPNAIFTPTSAGTFILEWSIDNGVCDVLSNTDQLIIELFNEEQAPANAGDNIEICSNQLSVNLSGNEPLDPAVGTWTVVQGTGNFSDLNNPNSSVSGYSIGTNTYRWTIDNGECIPSQTFDDVEVVVYNENVPLAEAGDDLEICNNFGPVVLNASQFEAPASGIWEVISGTGVFSNSSDPNSLVSGWSVGENVYQWSVDNGPCSGGNNGDQITITVFDINADQSNSGDDQEICLPQTSTTLNATTPSFPSTGFWTVESGTGLFADSTDPNTLVSGLSVGNNIFKWTIDNGACAGFISESTVNIALFEDGAYVSIPGSDQNFCEPINSTTLQGNTPPEPSSGEWTLVQGAGLINDPSNPETTVSNLAQGENIFQWTVYGGPCPSGDASSQVSINIFESDHPEVTTGADIDVCTPESTAQLFGTNPVEPAVGTWIQVSGPNSATLNPNINSPIVSNLIPGVYEFQWQVNNGPCETELLSDNVLVNVYDSEAPFPDAGEDIEICTPNNSVILDGSEPVGAAIGTWSIVQGGGTFSDFNDPNATVSNTPLGVNIYQWTINNGPCGFGQLVDVVEVRVYDENSPDPIAGSDQFLCSPENSVVVFGNTPTGAATVTWSLVSGAGTPSNPNATSTQITGLQIGENVFSYTIYNGPCSNSGTSDEVSIFVFDSGAPSANAGDDQEICTPTSVTSMNADPAVNPGVGEWNQISGPNTALVSNVNSPVSSISNLIVGEYIFEWSLDYATCGSQSDQVVISVFDSSFILNDLDNDIELCSPDNFATLNAETPTFPATGQWEIIEGSLSFEDINNANTNVSNISLGTNTIVWSVYNGNCNAGNTTDTVSIILYPENLPSAFAGIDQEICSIGSEPQSLQMTAFALPLPGIGTWSVISGGGDFEDINDPNTIVNNIPIGINEFMWSADYGSCASPSSSTVIIEVYDASQPNANAGDDQEFCTPVTTIQLDGNIPISPATGTWTQIVGTADITDISDPTTTVTNLENPGVYIFRWTIDNGPCENSNTNDLVTIFVYDENAPESETGEDQELCLPINNTNLSGNLPTFPGLGTWTQIEGFGTINNANNPNSPVSNLSLGDNCFVWEMYNGPCSNSNSSDTLCIKVFDPESPSSDAGEDIDICSTTSSISLAASVPIYPSIGTWTQTQGTTATISDINDPNALITNLSVGVNQFQWTVYNGPCNNGTTSDVVNVNVFDVNQNNADAGLDQDICLPVNSTNLQGNSLTSPATGIWTILQGSGNILDPTNPTSLVSELGLGSNAFIWNISNGACPNGQTQDTVFINVFDNTAQLATTGPDIQECAPIDVLTITANAALNASTGSWSQPLGDAIINDENQNNTEISNLNIGTYQFVWTLDNGACGSSSDTLVVEIFNPEDEDAFAGDNQNFCTPVNSTFLEGSAYTPPATGNWNIVVGSGNVIDLTDPNSEIENLTVGETILSWTVDNGPCNNGVTIDFVSIFIYDESAPNADAGEDQEYCLPINETNLNALPATFPAIGSWSILQGTGIIEDINDPNSLITDLTQGECTAIWSVNNGPCPNGITQDTVSVFIFPDEFDLADAGLDQSLCSPASETIMNAADPAIPSLGTWGLTNGSASIVDLNNPETEIIQLGIGTNTFSWLVDHGPCDPETSVDFVSILVYDSLHPPAFAGNDIELCLPEDSVFLAADATQDPAEGTWSLISGEGIIQDVLDPETQVLNLEVGNNFFVWTVDNGPCVNPITMDTMCVKVFTDESPLANAGPDLQICGVSTVDAQATIPEAPSYGTWSYSAGPSSYSIADVNDPNTEFSALVIGEYEFLWTVYNGPCLENVESTDTLKIEVFDFNQPPAYAGDTLEYCWPIDNIMLNATAVTFPSFGTWSTNSTVSISDVNDPNATLTNLSIGEHILTWSVFNGPCESTADDLVIQIYDPSTLPADAGADQNICTSDGGTTLAVMDGNPVSVPSFGTWEVVFGPNPIISNVNDAAAEVSNIGYGETQLVWTIYNGPCDPPITSDTMSIFHFDSDILPNAGPPQEFCGINPDTLMLFGNAPIGNTAVGTWEIISQPDTLPPTILNINDENSLITDFTLGVYELAWIINNGFCGIDTSYTSITFYDPDVPSAMAGLDMDVCEDEFEPFNLDGNPVNLPAISSWSSPNDSTVLNSETISNPDAEVISLGSLPGPLTEVENVFIYTVDNGVCGISQDSVIFTLIDCLTIDVPDAFSPNADGVNDTWEIPNLHKYPENEIKIFNRWGTPVFEQTSYDGTWNGESNHPATIGTDLPVGTYFYTLDLKDGTPIFKGFVYLKR